MKKSIGKIINKDAQKIYDSIEKSTYMWRTVEGISKEIKLPMFQTKSNIEDLKSKGVIIVSSKRNKDGRILYTTKQKYYSNKNIISRIISVLADEVK